MPSCSFQTTWRHLADGEGNQASNTAGAYLSRGLPVIV